MARQNLTKAKCRRELLQTIRELRMLLGEINQKLDHLIERCRRFYFTDDLSHSPKTEFHR